MRVYGLGGASWLGRNIDRHVKNKLQQMMDKGNWKTVNQLVKELDLAVDTTGGNDTIFAHISNIVAMAKEYKLTEEFWSNAADSLAVLGQVLTVTPRQALIFSLLVELSDDRRIRLNDVARLLKCN